METVNNMSSAKLRHYSDGENREENISSLEEVVYSGLKKEEENDISSSSPTSLD